jgi:hypothetical protein
MTASIAGRFIKMVFPTMRNLQLPVDIFRNITIVVPFFEGQKSGNDEAFAERFVGLY